MAAGQKLYPRATVKKIVKAHSRRNLSKNVDVLVSSEPKQTRLCAFTNRVNRYFSIMHSSCKRKNTLFQLCKAFGNFRPNTDLTKCRLMKEASINAKQAGERGISAKSIKKVTEVRSLPLNALYLHTV